MNSWVIVRTDASLERLGGRTVLGRLIEMLRRNGSPVSHVLCADELVSPIEDEVRCIDPDCLTTPLSRLDSVSIDPDEPVLLADGQVVFDTRLIEIAAGWTEETALVDSAPPSSRHKRPIVQGNDFAGLAVVKGSLARDVVVDPVSGLVDVTVCDVATLPTYSRPLRRDLRHFWVLIVDDNDVRLAKKMLVNASGKGHQELAVLLFNRPVETFLMYYVCDWRITPNQITIIGNIIAYGTTAAFAFGHLWLGILIALVAEVLDGLDGRQARIQIRTSRLGEFEHVLDKIHEISWMAALGWYFSNGFADITYLWLTLAWIVFHNIDNLSYSVFRSKRGIVIDEVGRFDATVRLFASNRNNNILFLAAGLLLGVPLQAYWFILAWSAVTPVIHWIRVWMLLSRPEVEA